jgi:hypothetical protein
MRDRLIELLTDDLPFADNPLQYVIDELVERIADHLLANGVIVPPCKVGDTVYYIFVDKVYSFQVEKVEIVQHDIFFGTEGHFYWYSLRDIGKTVFLSKEEAEKALRGEG